MGIKEQAKERLNYEISEFGKGYFEDDVEVDCRADELRGMVYLARSLNLINKEEFCNFISRIIELRYDNYEYIYRRDNKD